MLSITPSSIKCSLPTIFPFLTKKTWTQASSCALAIAITSWFKSDVDVSIFCFSIISSKLFILSLYIAASSKLKSIAHLFIFSFNISINFSSFPDRNRIISSIILLYSSLVTLPVHGPTHLFICKFKQGLILVFIALSMSMLQVLIGYIFFIIHLYYIQKFEKVIV